MAKEWLLPQQQQLHAQRMKQQPAASLTALWSTLTSLLTTVVLVLNLYLAGLLLRPSSSAPLLPLQQQQQQAAAAGGYGYGYGYYYSSSNAAAVPGTGAEQRCVVSSPQSAGDYAALRAAGLLPPGDSPFRTAGIFAHSLIVTGAFRTGPAGWAVVGMGAGPIFTHPDHVTFECVWLDAGAPIKSAAAEVVSESVKWHTPGINYRPGAHLTLTVDCLFPRPVGVSDSGTAGGGALLLRVREHRRRMDYLKLAVDFVSPLAGWSGPADADAWMFDRLREQVYSAVTRPWQLQLPPPPLEENEEPVLQLVATTEAPGSFDPAAVSPAGPFRYEHLYCGSPLYALGRNLSAAGVAEWLAYHYHLWGPKSHFVLHDGGAIRSDPLMQQALKPWIELGIVVVKNVEHLLSFHSFYHNQNLVLNMCLHQYKFVANRLWFLDVDEYIVVRPPHTLQELLTHNATADVLKFKQLKFSDKICRPPAKKASRAGNAWIAETLLFRKDGDHPGEQKYVLLNPRVMLSTGIHDPFESNLRGNATFSVEVADVSDWAAYYHYHDSIGVPKSRLCSKPVPADATTAKATTTGFAAWRGHEYDWTYDDAILPHVAAAKSFIRGFFAARKMPSPV